MAAALFLLLAFLFGDRLRRLFVPDTRRLFAGIAGTADNPDDVRPLPPAWTFELPAALLLGILPLTWAVYLAACAFDAVLPLTIAPLLPANVLVLALAALCVVPSLVSQFRAHRSATLRRRLPVPRVFLARLRAFRPARPSLYLFSLLAFAALAWYLMASVFYVKDGALYAGATVFSDFAPHTALIRSFSHGRNFPTEYPMFSGDGIRYHFLFLFLTGNLEFLGLRIDVAFNLLGALGLVAFCLLLGSLAVLLVRRRSVFLVAPMLLFLRSSLAFLTTMARMLRESDGDPLGVLVGLLVNRRFIGDTPYENWGLWAVNVYGNQRHLLWGFAILLLALFLLLPLWRKARRPFLLSRAAWIPEDFRPAVAAGLMLCMLPYFHGSALIGAFLVLGTLAVFSSGRLSFVVALVPAGLSALVQARFFSGGATEVASPRILLGFVSTDLSFGGILLYAATAFGVAFLLLPAIPLLYPKRHAVLWLAFLTPFLFAFTVSLTPDVVVNHKFIVLTFALENILLAGLLCRLARPPKEAGRIRRTAFRTLAVLLAVFLTAPGCIDTWTYFVANRITVHMDLDSPVAAWIESHTSPDAIFLTPPYNYNAFFLAGRRAFLGWPYYSWSAGHDTRTRSDLVQRLYHGTDGADFFRSVCAENGITYVILDDVARFESKYTPDEDFLDRNFQLVANFPDRGNMKIYALLEAS